MKALNRFATRLFNFAARRRIDERFHEEMESHIAAQTEDYVHSGMSYEEARRQARLKFGAAQAVRESYQAEKGLPSIENLLFDLRYALRVLRKSPSFTIVALLTLTLGIGANIVAFGVLNAIVLHPLAISDPQNLYQLRPKPHVSGRLLTTSYPAFQDLRKRNSTFRDMAGFYGYSHGGLNWQGHPIKAVSGYEVTGNYFDLLGVRPQLGRFFHEAEEHGLGSTPYIVLSNDLWRIGFHSNPGVVGTTVELNKDPYTVIGVAAPEFQGTEKFHWPEYWIPLVNKADGTDSLKERASVAVTVLGRLKPGVTAQQATDNLNSIVSELAKEYPDTDKDLPVRLISPGLRGDDGEVIRGFLFGVMALALLVLLAACTNLASLFAARAADRGRELALRVALGSSRRRLIRQLLTEAIIVAAMGGATGLGFAYFLLHGLNRWLPFEGNHLVIAVDLHVYLAGLIATLGSAFLVGLFPAKQAWQNSPLQMMKSDNQGMAHFRGFALRDLLLGAQIAICTLLVTASLVAVRGMVAALHAPLGIQPKGVMLVSMDLSQAEQSGDIAMEKQKALIQAAQNISGVTAVGIINSMPIGGGAKGIPVFPPGTTEFTLDKSLLETRLYAISPEYIHAAGTHQLSGRDISWNDTAQTPKVAIINENFARKMWDDASSAIGQHFYLRGTLTEVVGVVETGKYHDLAEAPLAATFVPITQYEDSAAVLVVKSQLPSAEASTALRRILGSVEPNVPFSIESWPDALEDLLFPARAATMSLGAMGVLAAMLAVTGVFGMAAYSVSRRIKELGIRMALGADKIQVTRAAVGRPIFLLASGSVIGLVAGFLASSLLKKMVYQANPSDPAVIAGVVLTMTLLGIAASAIPVRRALSINPSKLIREE